MIISYQGDAPYGENDEYVCTIIDGENLYHLTSQEWLHLSIVLRGVCSLATHTVDDSYGKG